MDLSNVGGIELLIQSGLNRQTFHILKLIVIETTSNLSLYIIYRLSCLLVSAEKNLVSISKIRNLSENDNFQLESLVNEYINNICIFLYFESEIFKFEISTQFLVLTLNRKIFNYT